MDFSTDEWGRKPQWFLKLFNEPLASKMELKATIHGYDKLGSRCDISFYLYCCNTIFKFQIFIPVVGYLSCLLLSARPTTVIIKADNSSETSVTTYYSKRCHIPEYWNVCNYEFIRL